MEKESLTGWQKIEHVINCLTGTDEDEFYVNLLVMHLKFLRLSLSLEEEKEVILDETIKTKIREALSMVFDLSTVMEGDDNNSKVREGADIIKNLFPDGEGNEEEYRKAFAEICNQIIENAGEALFQALNKDKITVRKTAQALSRRLEHLAKLLRT
jgi:hypothetical protein